MELEVLQTAVLRAAGTRNVDEVLQLLVPGCATCPMRAECAGR